MDGGIKMLRKKTASAILAIALTVTLMQTAVPPALAADDVFVSVIIDGRNMTFDVPPRIINSRTMVPLRVIFETLGASIVWDNETKTVTAAKDDTVIVLTVGDASPTVNGQAVTIDQPMTVLDGRTFVPLRFVAEALGVKVDYVSSVVYITTPPLYIDGTEIATVQRRIEMTIETSIYENDMNILINRLYQFLDDYTAEEIDEPEYFMDKIPNLDILFSYLMVTEYSFLNSAGLDGSVIRQFRTYQRIALIEEGQAIATGTDHGPYIVHDITNDKWYKMPDNYPDLISAVLNIGEWKMIF